MEFNAICIEKILYRQSSQSNHIWTIFDSYSHTQDYRVENCQCENLTLLYLNLSYIVYVGTCIRFVSHKFIDGETCHID